MNIIPPGLISLFKSCTHQSPQPVTQSAEEIHRRNYQLGVDAGVIAGSLNYGVSKEVFKPRYDEALETLNDLMSTDAFNYEHFDDGFRSVTGTPYGQSHDVFHLKSRFWAKFEAGEGVREPETAPH